MPAAGRDVAEFSCRGRLLPLDEFLAWVRDCPPLVQRRAHADLPLPCGVEDPPPSTVAAHIGGSLRLLGVRLGDTFGDWLANDHHSRP